MPAASASPRRAENTRTAERGLAADTDGNRSTQDSGYTLFAGGSRAASCSTSFPCFGGRFGYRVRGLPLRRPAGLSAGGIARKSRGAQSRCAPRADDGGNDRRPQRSFLGMAERLLAYRRPRAAQRPFRRLLDFPDGFRKRAGPRLAAGFREAARGRKGDPPFRAVPRRQSRPPIGRSHLRVDVQGRAAGRLGNVEPRRGRPVPHRLVADDRTDLRRRQRAPAGGSDTDRRQAACLGRRRLANPGSGRR